MRTSFLGPRPRFYPPPDLHIHNFVLAFWEPKWISHTKSSSEGHISQLDRILILSLAACDLSNKLRLRADDLSVICQMWSFIYGLGQLPKSLAAANWPIFKISASIYVISIVVLFDAKIDLHIQQLNHFDLPLRMLKVAFPEYKIWKFPGGACARITLDTPASRGRLSLGKLFLSNALSLHSTGTRVF